MTGLTSLDVPNKRLVFRQYPLAILLRAKNARLAVKKIDLLQRQSSHFGDEEVCENPATKTRRPPDEKHFHTQTRSFHAVNTSGGLVDEVRRRITDSEIPQPIASYAEGHTLCANIEWEYFSGDNPDYRTPRDSVERNIYAYESDQHTLRSQVHRLVCLDVASSNTNNGDDEFAETHPRGTDEQQAPAAHSVDELDTEYGRGGVDNIANDSDNESVIDPSGLEERSAVIENEIDAGKLLPRL